MLIWQHGDYRIVIARNLSYLDQDKTIRQVIEEAMKANQHDYKSYCDYQLKEWDKRHEKLKEGREYLAKRDLDKFPI